MRKKTGVSLVELLVIIVIVVMLIAIFMPALGKVKPISQRVVCRTNLEGLGTAITVYANDYDDNYPQLPGEGPWSKRLGFDYDFIKPDFNVNGAEEKVSRTITASWYLLVREADVPPKIFVCPASEMKPFEGANPGKKDLVQLWDFGHDPHSHVSYSYHNPYGKFPADGSRSAAFAVAADMNPWFDMGDVVPAGETNKSPQILRFTDWENADRREFKIGNHQLHKHRSYQYGEGQNVLFADGHASFENQPNVGVKNDNIYTFWSAQENPTEQDVQGGRAPTSRSPENDAKSKEDSFLAI